MRAVGASWACQGTFPDCNGLGALPFGRDPLADIQLYHRLLSYVLLGLVLWLAVEAYRTQRAVQGPPLRSLALLGATVVDAGVGAVVGLHRRTRRSRDRPYGSQRAGVVGRGDPHRDRSAWRRVLALAPHANTATASARTFRAYVQLTKPRVMSLLLATTAAAMVIAARGMPPTSASLSPRCSAAR